MKFDDVVSRIRCPDCGGNGLAVDEGASCEHCDGSGINPEIIEEASGWGTWAMSVHDRPGWIVAVHVGMTDPTGHASSSEPWSTDKVGESV
jgi:hypothetical protein